MYTTTESAIVHIFHIPAILSKGMSLSYQFDQSISVLRVVRWHFSFKGFNRTVCKQTVETLIRRRVLWSAMFPYVP